MVLSAACPAALAAQPAPASSGAAPSIPAPSRVSEPSHWWLVGGGGFSVARAGCATCDRAGVFAHSRSLLIDAGVRVRPNVDAGVELLWVSSRIEQEKPIRTTFILGVAQLRPWQEHGFFLRAGMGISFAGNGIYSPIGPALAPPFSTNALGVTYGTGWVFGWQRRRTVQLHATHHVAALGQLTTVDGGTLENVIGNYWTVGAALVLR
jgi:hypothetical protein